VNNDLDAAPAGDGIRFAVRVLPRSARLGLTGIRNGRLALSLTAPPVDDAANDQCIAFFSRAFKKRKRDIQMISGARSRNKTLLISGLDEKSFRETVQRLLKKD
jgi:uncharacterized protein (TIGR00251 family)